MATYKLRCQNPGCGQTFESGRQDKKFFRDACRVAANRQRRRTAERKTERIDQWEANLRLRIAELEADNESKRNLIDEYKRIREAGLQEFRHAKDRLQEIKEELDSVKGGLGLSDSELWNYAFNPRVKRTRELLWESDDFLEQSKYDSLAKLLPELSPMFVPVDLTEGSPALVAVSTLRNKLERTQSELQGRLLDTNAYLDRVRNYLMRSLNPVPEAQAALDENNERIAVLQAELAKGPPPLTHVSSAPEILPLQLAKPSTEEYSLADLREIEFDNIGPLPGEVGRFLGRLERSMLAIALTGDSGAGKSTFSFVLAKLFLDLGYKARYFTLEEGVSQLTIEKANHAGLTNDNSIRFTGRATLAKVRRAAPVHDLILIDSFQKLGAKAQDFDRLRQEFPKTVFIVIFQKTTAGTMRGGSSVKYDSSAVIDVRMEDGERMAYMEKSRYGTQGWLYSIDEQVILREGPG